MYLAGRMRVRPAGYTNTNYLRCEMFELFGNTIAYQLLSLSPQSQLGQAVQFFIMDITKILLLLGVIVYIIGLIRQWLDPVRVRNAIAVRGKVQGRVMAILLGAVTPFCSCSSVPLFIGFLEAGIPLGVTFAFLTASPMINEIVVVMLLGMVGWEITLTYVAAGIFVAYISSMIIGRFNEHRLVESYVWQIQLGQQSEQSVSGWFARHQLALAEVHNIVSKVWKWVVLGVGLGAAAHGYAPTEWLAQLGASDNWFAVPLAVLVAVPLYIDAVATIPIAEVLMGKGVALGTTLAFIMAAAALSVPEMLILRKVLLWRTLAMFASILTLSFILVGWLINFIFY